MKNFITNSKTDNLKKRLTQLITKSEQLKFLVGFFYFSGIKELYEGLKRNTNVKIKILVGLNIDKTNKRILELAETNHQSSIKKTHYDFLQSVKNSINRDESDTKDFYEQVKFFLDLIKQDKLVIRKSLEPNHAKLYIFKLWKDQIKRHLFITGSSNLTNAGLCTQGEFNVEISDYGFDTAEKYFDTLWDEATKITEDNTTKSKLIETIEKETLIKEISPYEAFILILKTYLDSFEQKEVSESLKNLMQKNDYTPYQYQLDAVRQALAIIEKNHGVIIADVVGLGKTVIACCIAKELKARGMVICPPGLIGDRNKNSGWKKYLEEFLLYDWEVRSVGELEKISDFIRKTEDIGIIIIDESHRFRNQDTKNYEFLKNICRNKIVILLTATPFNNQPEDILSLLKLFITPKKSHITLEDNLVEKFRYFKTTFNQLNHIKKYSNSENTTQREKAENYYKTMFGNRVIDKKQLKRHSNHLAKQIRDIIKPVTIRRNRLDLQNNPLYKREIPHFSKLNDPKEWFFRLSIKQSEFYDKIIKQYFGKPNMKGQFKGAIYRPFEYEISKKSITEGTLTKEQNFQYVQQKNLYDFMRRLLVKRFESSFGSFDRSINNFQRITIHALKFIEKTGKFILDRALIEKIYNLDIDDIEKELEIFSEKLKINNYPKNHRIYDVNNFHYKDKFIKDIESDIKLFKKIQKILIQLDLIKYDPKAECLLENNEN